MVEAAGEEAGVVEAGGLAGLLGGVVGALVGGVAAVVAAVEAVAAEAEVAVEAQNRRFEAPGAARCRCWTGPRWSPS